MEINNTILSLAFEEAYVEQLANNKLSDESLKTNVKLSAYLELFDMMETVYEEVHDELMNSPL